MIVLHAVPIIVARIGGGEVSHLPGVRGIPSSDVPRAGSPYAYGQQRRALLDKPQVCHLCGSAPATSADHEPPLSRHVHVPGTGCCTLIPSGLRCQRRQGGRLMRQHEPERKRSIPPPSRRW
jgi:hypothetical protein